MTMNLKGEAQKDIQMGRIGQKDRSDVAAYTMDCLAVVSRSFLTNVKLETRVGENPDSCQLDVSYLICLKTGHLRHS